MLLDKMEELKKEKILKYIEITNKALKKLKIYKNLTKEQKKAAEDILDMAQRYYEDAQFFLKKGQLINAFGAINYAHGWIDSGSKIGLFNVKDSKLFVLK